MLQAGIAAKVTIVHSFSLIYAANMSACASAGFRDTTATMLRSYAIDQTKQDNPALLRQLQLDPKTIHAFFRFQNLGTHSSSMKSMAGMLLRLELWL